MQLPVMPPVKTMLAKSVPEVPEGDFLYEPHVGRFPSAFIVSPPCSGER